MEKVNRNYWGCRIDNRNRDYFWKELQNNGILRQGWGYDPSHDLRQKQSDPAVERNRAMLKVKKGDIVLIPHIPGWEDVTIVEASEDWNNSYQFSIDPEKGDYGHMFPAKVRCYFNRNNAKVKEGIRSTLHNFGRFWRISLPCGMQIETLLASDKESLKSAQSYKGRFETAMSNAFAEFENEFRKKTHEICTFQFNGTEWEFALVEGLKLLFPEPYFFVERVGGKLEKQHGSDIAIRFHGLSRKYEYIIAIQVKDYTQGFDIQKVIEQINKADKYCREIEQYVLVDKIVIVTKSTKEIFKSMDLPKDIHFIFAEDLQEILLQMAMTFNLHKLKSID